MINTTSQTMVTMKDIVDQHNKAFAQVAIIEKICGEENRKVSIYCDLEDNTIYTVGGSSEDIVKQVKHCLNSGDMYDAYMRKIGKMCKKTINSRYFTDEIYYSERPRIYDYPILESLLRRITANKYWSRGAGKTEDALMKSNHQHPHITIYPEATVSSEEISIINGITYRENQSTVEMNKISLNGKIIHRAIITRDGNPNNKEAIVYNTANNTVVGIGGRNNHIIRHVTKLSDPIAAENEYISQIERLCAVKNVPWYYFSNTKNARAISTDDCIELKNFIQKILPPESTDNTSLKEE